MTGNINLQNAKNTKNDEFYTQYEDVKKELSYYKKHFFGKTVYCNCDDPERSNFWMFLHKNFSALGLKKLIATFYNFKQENPRLKSWDESVRLETYGLF